MACSEQTRKLRSEAAKRRWADPVFKEMVSRKLRKRISIPCQCGCGKMTGLGKKFFHGHNSRVAHPMQGRKMPAATLEKLRALRLGKPSPMAGKHHSEASRKKMSESHKGIPLSEKHRASIGEKSIQVWAGKSSQERKQWAENISAGEKGKPPMNPEALKRMAMSKRGKRCSPKTEFTSERMKALHRDPVYMEKVRKALNIKPNKSEAAILNLLNLLYPDEWKYTGDFSFMINGKCPDFVNCNGQKKIIELFGDYWHRGQNPEDRAAIFAPFGYKTLIIWEGELKNPQSIILKIRKFAEAA